MNIIDLAIIVLVVAFLVLPWIIMFFVDKKYPSIIVCPVCQGNGYIGDDPNASELWDCPKCQGNGQIYYND